MHPWKPVFILYNLNEFNKYAEMLCSITLKIRYALKHHTLLVTQLMFIVCLGCNYK